MTAPTTNSQTTPATEPAPPRQASAAPATPPAAGAATHTLNKPQIAALTRLVDYQAFEATGSFMEPSVLRKLSGRPYSGLRAQGLIAEQWGGFASWRPFVAITEYGRRAVARVEERRDAR